MAQAVKGRKTTATRRREKKNIERGAAHIQSTFNNTIVTVTDVECAKDLKNATVYFSFFSKKYSEKDVKTALKGAAGYLRTYLAGKLNLRETPLLAFSYDNSIERGNRISELLRDVMPSSAAEQTDDEN